MPHKSYREEDPLYRNISNWNDGVEYIPADHNHDRRAPYARSPERVSSRKAEDYTPKRPIQRHHTEPSRNDHADRPRRTRYRSPSPPDMPREQHRQRGYDTPPRAHRDAHYPPTSRHGRPPLDPSMTSPPQDDRSRQRTRQSRSLSSSPPRRRDDHHSDRRHEKTAYDAKPAARPSVQRSKSTKDSIKSVMNMEMLKNPRLKTAAAAAFAAGSHAAMSTPGAWNGQKGAKIATAALGAAALDALRKGKSDGSKEEAQSKDRGRSKPKSSGGRGGIEAVGSTIGGFLLDQLANKRKPRN